jgi:hypothetical protein
VLLPTKVSAPPAEVLLWFITTAPAHEMRAW